jgi:large subunit ribosomal protein L6
MSRIGIQPIEVPSGVTVEISKDEIKVKGSKGELKRSIHPSITVEQTDNIIKVTRASDSKEDRSLHGLFRSLIFNMVEGVSKGYEKKLEVIGVGYRFQASGSKITLSLGFSHPVEYKAKEGVTFEADPENKQILIVKGIDKEQVGETAAKIRSYRPPEPYKGKGIRYIDEYVARKAGKAAGGSGDA